MEWIILYALLSTGGNMWQMNIIGELESERDNFRNIAEHCTKDGEQERRSATLEASRRAITETKDDAAYQEYRHRSTMALQDSSNACLDSIAGDLADELVDAERRYVERLREHRVQPKP